MTGCWLVMVMVVVCRAQIRLCSPCSVYIWLGVYSHKVYSSVWPATFMVIVGMWHKLLNMFDWSWKKVWSILLQAGQTSCDPLSQGCAVETSMCFVSYLTTGSTICREERHCSLLHALQFGHSLVSSPIATRQDEAAHTLAWKGCW